MDKAAIKNKMQRIIDVILKELIGIESWEKRIQEVFRLKTRFEAIDVIKTAYNEGFRYIVRDSGSEYLSFYNYKPKKYRDLESWGYTNADLSKADCMSSVVILKNIDITEINWKNQKPTQIKEFLEREENK